MTVNSQTSGSRNNRWAVALTTISLVGFALLVAGLLISQSDRIPPLALWGLIALAMTLLLIGLGIGVAGKWYGVIVEKDRNRASLSRLQITLWTIIVVSAFLSIALARSISPTERPSAEAIAACKAEYVADAFDIDLADLEGTQDSEMADQASGAIAEGNEALEEATGELAGGMAALEEALAEARAGDTEEVLDELDDLQSTVADAQENLDSASAALSEASTELAASGETRVESETQVTLEQALEEAEQECVPGALRIRFPEELLLVLGISTASFAGSSLIKNNKQKKPSLELKRLRTTVEEAERELEEKAKQAAEALRKQRAAEAVLARDQQKLETIPETPAGEEPSEEREKAEERVRSSEVAYETAEELTKAADSEKETAEQALAEVREALAARKDQGLLAVADEPSFTDIFYGDQEGDAQYIDLGKVQMFFFSVAIMVAYGLAISGLLGNENLVLAPLGVDFPAFSSSMTTLLGISHAGYLTVKTPDRPQTV